MHKLLACFLAFALFCGCSADSLPVMRRVRNTAELDTLPVKISFAVDSSAGSIIFAAAEHFCRKAEILSRGQLDITAVSADAPFAELDSGTSAIILASSAAASARSRLFAITAEGFRYGSYEQFTMTLNAQKVLRTLSTASGAQVYAAYYTGSNIFAGGDTLDGTLFVSREESTEASGTQLGIYTVEGSGADAALALPGFVVAEVVSPEERLNAIFTPGKLAELTFDEIAPESLETARQLHRANTLEAESDEPAEDTAGLSQIAITRSFHTAAPAWLVLKAGLWESLPKSEQAALNEAAAYLAGEIDAAYLTREDNRLAELAELDITISEQLTGIRSTRRRITRARNAAAALLSDEERAFATLLNSVY